jgi:hypothetical protein
VSSATAKKKLKDFVELRGALAHGEKPAPKVTKRDVWSTARFLAPLRVRTANQVRQYCHGTTGKNPWGGAKAGNVV